MLPLNDYPLVEVPEPSALEELLDDVPLDPRRLKVYASEPARWRWNDGAATWCWSSEPEPILFRSRAPTCTACGAEVTWLGPPSRRRGLYVYAVFCRCVDDSNPRVRIRRIVSPFPLQMGGTREWWQQVQRVTFRGRG